MGYFSYKRLAYQCRHFQSFVCLVGWFLFCFIFCFLVHSRLSIIVNILSVTTRKNHTFPDAIVYTLTANKSTAEHTVIC